MLAIGARADEGEHLIGDVRAFLGDRGAEAFPGWEVLPGENVSPSVDTMGRRLNVLARVRAGDSFVVSATVQGATQLVAAHSEGIDVITLAVGAEMAFDEIAARLVAMGYERNYMVERRGEFAMRGNLLDVFTPAADRPVRAEFWGDELTSLRQFALASQRSLEAVERLDITPAREELTAAPGSLAPLTSLLPAGTPAVIFEPKRVRDRADEVMEQVEEWMRITDQTERRYAALDEILQHSAAVVLMSSFTEPGAEDLQVETWTQSAGKPEALMARLGTLIRGGYRAVIAASLPETAERLQKNLATSGLNFTIDDEAPQPDAAPGGSIVVAELQRGFVLPWARLALVAESDLTGRRSGAARRRIAARKKQPTGPLDLSEGDLVVHEVHGIGRYKGLVDRALLGVHREYIVIEYAKDDTLYVPSDQTDMVGKYIGGEAPRLNRLGSPEWRKTKARVRRKAREIAGQLVKLYAERSRSKGFAFGPDTPWQRELEDAFPYEETPDQLRAIDEVKDDMESDKPMDRLVCGDVGYGKTEIAVRAAFKAVAAGKQVAVLVPTTILAQQHHATFVERYRNFPLRVEMLSRFLSASESKKVLADTASGKVDVIVGTHRLLQGDVKFSDLGLLILDEEQRFGVEQKEKLKAVKANVDVLTLTATPIPRTLELAMSGLRDMSIVDTPPENRHPVMTYVGDFEEEVVSSAVRRELLRDGQVFYVHHRVQTIDHAAAQLRDLVPEARIGVAHGQMDERNLEQSMVDFADAKTNVLVCTTIIESGLDMPTVNTLIVERSDLLGLSQMYQLRGRVGRAHERAYAYLFFPPTRSLTEQAHERLKTISEYSGLGSGYRIAMRDLEIRGAGNLLGAEQHGHIEEIGFDLYVKLVSSAIDEAKGLPYQEDVEVRIDLPLEAFIPKSYVGDENLRLEAYRKIAAVRDDGDLAEVRAEVEDRYGSPIPAPVEGLLKLARLRSTMMARTITEAATVAGNLRIRPIELEESRQVRLQRILPRAEWRPATRTLLIPEVSVPKTGVVDWVDDIIQQLTSVAS